MGGRLLRDPKPGLAAARAWACWVLLVAGACSGSSGPSGTLAERDAGGTRTATSDAGSGRAIGRAQASSLDAGGPPAGDAGASSDSDSGSDGGPVRHVALASTGAQLLVSGPDLGLQLTDADLAQDADVIAIHQEFYGVPWDAFEANTDPPPEWTQRMQALARSAKTAGRPVFLSITPLNGDRKTLAARTRIDNGAIKTDDNWAAPCYDFASAPDAAQKQRAYLRYLRQMMAWFEPRWLNLAVEINLFFEKCPSAAPGLVELEQAAYDAAKAQDPRIIAFPSIQIDHLYGYSTDSCADPAMRDQCFKQALAQVQPLAGDRFAMSSYPYLQGQQVSDLPADWFVRAANILGEPPLIAETGWLSTDLRAQLNGSCQTPVYGSSEEAANYLAYVLDAADAHGIELVTWWSDRDLLPTRLMTDCPCSLSSEWCSVVDTFRMAAGADPQSAYVGEILLKAFGTMGLRDYDGVPKPELMSRWSAARVLPLVL